MLLHLAFFIFIVSITNCGQHKSSSDLETAIAFMSSRLRHSEIFLMMPDGTQQKQLTESSTASYIPVWNSNKKKIAFVSVEENMKNLMIINLKDKKLQKITSVSGDIFDLEWSPNGAHIAFDAKDPRFGSSIFTVDINTKKVTRLKEGASNPTYSQDGTKIAFRFPAESKSDIYVMSLSTGSIIKLTSTRSESEPDWSSDGLKIAFTSTRNGDADIWIMDYDGKNQKQLTFGPTNDFSPSWSPDGEKIAFVSDRDSENPELIGLRNYEIYTMNADGSDQTRLTFDPKLDVQPAWSR